MSAIALAPLVVHGHRHFILHPHGPPIGYAGIALAAFVSWVGLIGAGEAALVTGAIFAARGRLDIGTVVVAAWAGAYVGGIVGWFVGRRVGRPIASAPGPFRRTRLKALRGGERFFQRFGPLAVFFTPSWVAGVLEVGLGMYLAASAAAALVWAAVLGLGTYLIGPEVAEYVNEIGMFGSILIAAAAVAAGAIALVRRRRRATSG
jgi:membrane protein DedA with SNARE-associated domain